MPAFGRDSDALITALAESDGEDLQLLNDSPAVKVDPTAADFGPLLVGFEGYACVSCHVWKGDTMGVVEPSSAGPELTTVTKRIRRTWFDRWLESPLRIHPHTPMPSIFRKGQAAMLDYVLDGDAHRQKDAMWNYLSRGSDARDPRRKPPYALAPPRPGQPPHVAQIPILTPDHQLIEGICLLTGEHDLVLYDVNELTIRSAWTAARLEAKEGHHPGKNGYHRDFRIVGTAVEPNRLDTYGLQLFVEHQAEDAVSCRFLGYDRLPGGMQIRTRHEFESGSIELVETIMVDRTTDRLTRRLQTASLPAGSALQLKTGLPDTDPAGHVVIDSRKGRVAKVASKGELAMRLQPDPLSGQTDAMLGYRLPPPGQPPEPAASGTAMGVAGDEYYERDRSLLERRRPRHAVWHGNRPKHRAAVCRLE